jgi:hypothetical protein
MTPLGIIGLVFGGLFLIALLYILSLAEKALKIYINKNKDK